jgi:hypothetical protein
VKKDFEVKPVHEKVLDALRHRSEVPLDVELADGKHLRVQNIAWVFDLSNPVALIYSNIGPFDRHSDLPTETFWAEEVVRIVDVDTGLVCFEASVS